MLAVAQESFAEVTVRNPSGIGLTVVEMVAHVSFCRFVIVTILRPRQQFEQMPARIAEVNTTPPVPIIQLPVFRILRMAAVRQASLLHPLNNGVEFRITYVKGIVMGLKRIILIEIECQSVIHLDGSEMPGRTSILKAEDVGEKTRRLFLVTRGHDRMIQFDSHDYLILGRCDEKPPVGKPSMEFLNRNNQG